MRSLHSFALAALVALCGCAGSGPPPTDSSDWFATIQRTIFDRQCLDAGCHNSQSQAGGMNLSAGASYNSLVNVPAENAAAHGLGMTRVAPNDPDLSFLLIKITNPGPGQGSRMPQSKDPLSENDIESIRQWILAGAPRTGTRGPTPTHTPVGPVRTATDSATPTMSATPTTSNTATATSVPVDTATRTATVTGSPPPTSTATVTPSTTETPTASPSPTVTATPGPFAQVQQIFNQSCVGAFCHDVQGRSGNVVLVEGQSYTELVGVQPDNRNARTAGLLRVDPGNPDNSFLVVKLEGPPPPMGSRMPFGQPPLSASEIQVIRDWITAGAPQ